MNTMSALLACVWMIPGALIGYIVARIFKWDAKLGAAIGALALFAVYFGSTIVDFEELYQEFILPVQWRVFGFSWS